MCVIVHVHREQARSYMGSVSEKAHSISSLQRPLEKSVVTYRWILYEYARSPAANLANTVLLHLLLDFIPDRSSKTARSFSQSCAKRRSVAL